MRLKSISKQIKSATWEIINAWQNTILADEKMKSSRRLSKLDLIDGMPVVLLAASKNLAQPIGKELNKKGVFGQKVSAQSKIRLEQGYSLAEVFREYISLKEHIILHLKKIGSISDQEYLLNSRLDRAIDEQLLNAVSAYSEHHIKELRKEAITDPLTKIQNRRAFFDNLDRELRRAKRYKHAVALLVVDIDNFKRLNDRLGHPAGDKYLKSFAGFLVNQSRQTDYVARIGGDEFSLLLPETTTSQASEVAKRIQSSFRKTAHLQKKIDGIGVSVGVGINGHFSALDIYKAADASLLKAKRRKLYKKISVSTHRY